MVTVQETSEAEALPACMLVQKAKLFALPRALHLRKGKRVNIYTDSKYVFTYGTYHWATFGEKKRVLNIRKQRNVMLNLLKAVMEPQNIVLIHCPGHQKTDSL